MMAFSSAVVFDTRVERILTYFRLFACVWDRLIVPCVENDFHRFSRK